MPLRIGVPGRLLPAIQLVELQVTAAERTPRLRDDPVVLVAGPDADPGDRGAEFDLIDGGNDAGLSGQQLQVAALPYLAAVSISR